MIRNGAVAAKAGTAAPSYGFTVRIPIFKLRCNGSFSHCSAQSQLELMINISFCTTKALIQVATPKLGQNSSKSPLNFVKSFRPTLEFQPIKMQININKILIKLLKTNQILVGNKLIKSIYQN